MLLFASLSGYSGYGQTAPVGITTLPLPFSTACPGSAITVPYTSTGINSTSVNPYPFTVQLSVGGSYIDIQTYQTITYSNVLVARLPTDLPTGQTYQVRVVSLSSSTLGTPSPSLLTIKNSPKPSAPLAGSLVLACMNPSANGMSIGSSIGLNTLSGSLLLAYTKDNFVYANDRIWDYGSGSRSFQVFPSGTNYGLYLEATYYFTQTINGCESDTTKTIHRTRSYMDAPTVVNYRFMAGGSVRYCQGDKAYPLSVYGYTPSRDSRFYVSIRDRFTGKIVEDYTPDTNVIGGASVLTI